MRHVLGAAGRRALEALAARDVLIGLDYDGTLAPIVERPGAARMRSRTRRLLVELARLYPVAIVSGRGRADALAHLQGVRVAAVLGNHGNEPSSGAARLRERVRRWLPVLAERLAGLAGVELEDKRYSLSVHYRRAPSPRRAEAAIRRAARSLGARLIGGKRVVNLLPRGASDKGRALAALARRLGCDTALYVGDDDTDEDVFARRALLGVRVGRSRRSRAAWYLRDQRELDDLLERLVRCRTSTAKEEVHATNAIHDGAGARLRGLSGRQARVRRTRPPGRRA